MKIVGHFIHGKWFCSEACADLDPETKQLQELMEKGIDFNNDNEEGDADANYANNEDIDL